MVADETRRGRGHYSDDEKASALTLLAVNNGNVKRTARLLGVPRSTLTAWAKGRGTHARVSELCHFKKESLADKFEDAARLLLDTVTLKAKIESASLLDTMKAVGICVDKMLLLRGTDPRRPRGRCNGKG